MYKIPTPHRYAVASQIFSCFSNELHTGVFLRRIFCIYKYIVPSNYKKQEEKKEVI